MPFCAAFQSKSSGCPARISISCTGTSAHKPKRRATFLPESPTLFISATRANPPFTAFFVGKPFSRTPRASSHLPMVEPPTLKSFPKSVADTKPSLPAPGCFTRWFAYPRTRLMPAPRLAHAATASTLHNATPPHRNTKPASTASCVGIMRCTRPPFTRSRNMPPADNNASTSPRDTPL